MQYQTQDGAGQAPRPIETASATTAADNADSGPTAYIITGVTLLLLLLLSWGISSIFAYVGQAVAESGPSSWSMQYEYPGYERRYDFDLDRELEDLGLGLDEDLRHIGNIG